MKNNLGFTIASYFVFWVLSVISPTRIFCQGSNPPTLSITAHGEPHISVHGLSGATYQLEYASTLSTTNWQVLTNFILGASPYTVVDSNAPLAGLRMYRALLLQTNVGVSYAPESLTAAEIFKFTSQGGGAFAINDTLVLNSPTTGMLVQQNNAPNGGISPVSVVYARLGPFLAQMSVIRSLSGFPTTQTNYYTIVFSGPSAGFFQVTDGVSPGTVGEFSRDQSFVGQQVAVSQLTGGENYSLLITNSGFTNVTTLIINSPVSGMLIISGNPPTGRIVPVTIEYQLLGPLVSQMQVVIPPSNGSPSFQTNSYYFVFATTNSGSYQSISGASTVNIGPLKRDRSLVGQQLASNQLTGGETYSMPATYYYSGTYYPITLVVNSTNSGVLISSANPPYGGITPISIEYQLLGPLVCQMQVVIPPNNGSPSFQTNSYYFVFSTTNSGSYQSISGPSVVNIGPFIRDQSLVGQQIASTQLIIGESYRLTSTNGQSALVEALVVNSDTSGIFVVEGSGLNAGIYPNVALQYLALGTLSGQIQVVIPPTPPNILTARTNTYLLVYTSNNSGQCQRESPPSTATVGSFLRNP